MFHIVLIPFFMLYAYVCLRIWQWAGKRLFRSHLIPYILVCAIPSVCFELSRLALNIPYSLMRFMAYVGGYWLAFAFYMIIFTVLIDALRLLGKALKRTAFLRKHAFRICLFSLCASLLIVAFGAYSARHLVMGNYSVFISTAKPETKRMNIVMVSDIHLGEFNGVSQLESMAAQINGLSPDLVVIAGDVFDNSTLDLDNAQKIKAELSSIKAKYGVYACLGNHDIYDGGAKATAFLADTSIRLLSDESAVIGDSLLLIGRKDYRDKQRASFDSLIAGADLPVIVLDHEPTDLAEEAKAGASLVLCGHTHRGQLFPLSLLTALEYEVDYGYAKMGNMQVIVSSGYGFWAAPVRVGSFCEIVQIQLNIGQ